MKARRASGGFTLLETVVALTLLAVMLAMLFGGLRAGRARLGRGHRTAATAPTRSCSRPPSLRKELTAALPVALQGPARGEARVPRGARGGPLRLDAAGRDRRRRTRVRLLRLRAGAQGAIWRQARHAARFRGLRSDGFLVRGRGRRLHPPRGREQRALLLLRLGERRQRRRRGTTSGSTRSAFPRTCGSSSRSARRSFPTSSWRCGWARRPAATNRPSSASACRGDEDDPQSAERGIALVLVIWVVTLLLVIAGSFLYAMRTDARAARNAALIARGDAIAQAAVSRALLELFKPQGGPEVWRREGAPRTWSFDGASVAVRFTRRVC